MNVAHHEGAQRRFRKRGGAKKKKRSTVDPPTDVRASDGPPSAAVVTTERGPAAPRYSPPNSGLSSQLDAELSRYLYQLGDDLERLRAEDSAGAGDDEDESPLLLLSRNALASLQPNLHEVACEPMGSRVLETLVSVAAQDPDAIAEALIALLSRGAKRVAALADHRCGSHVLQRMVEAVSAVAASGVAEGFVGEAMSGLGKLLSNWSLDEVTLIMGSSSGSHVFRAVVAALAGIPAEEPKEAKLDDSTGSERLVTYLEFGRVTMHPGWGACVTALAERMLVSDQGGIQEFLWYPTSSAALQCLLAAVSVCDRDVAKRIVVAAVGEANLYDVCIDACGARFMERVVVCLGSGYVLPKIKGRLAEMAKDSKANYVLQRVLLGLRGRGAVLSAWDELEQHLGEFLGFASTRAGVGLALVRAAEMEGDEQAHRRASRAVAKALGATGAKARFLVGVLMCGSLDRWERWREGIKVWEENGLGIASKKAELEDSTTVLRVGHGLGALSVLGVLICRSLLRFPGAPGQVARDSMANLTSAEVIALCGHPIGSRLVEQWVHADVEHGTGRVPSSVVTSVLDTCTLGALARHLSGAQVLSMLIPRAAGPVRKLAMDALAARASHLREHEVGRQVVRKCRVDDYLRRGDDWSAEETARDTRERIFKDILTHKVEDEEREGGENNAEGKSATGDKYVTVGVNSQLKKQGKKSRKRKDPSFKREDEVSEHFVESRSPSRNTVKEEDAAVETMAGLDTVLQAITDAAESKKRKKRKSKKMVLA